ncbi:sugar ABC transporter ATP-binding protein [Phosphitispora fastidiosa]|uniref:sugar ABC transporter ATP-binding protein n=1 Tax=Phosphitispora fastidiosa TaxID=2837202 RepID=UPI001E4ABE4A|nr:ribose transport system ATP-binding protein [Phosphitispora fastidiosa]
MKDNVDTLVMKHISKTFGGQRALSDAHINIKPGEVHGLLGQNGCGKSTLIKILAGYHAPDPGGSLEINGRVIKLPLHVGEFRKLGMSFVHQDLGLIPSLSVLENLRIGEIASKNRWNISWSKERKLAKEIFKQFNLNIDPSDKVSDLTQVERALLAIVRAVKEIQTQEAVQQSNRGLLVLDEPTVFLPRMGIDQLFGLVREIAKIGLSVLFVSHDLDEAKEITNRITILRDGHVVKTVETSQTTKEQLISAIIGRELETVDFRNSITDNKKIDIFVNNLSGKIIRDVSLSLRKGEILGLTGLVGSGFHEIPYLLFGADKASGHLEMDGESFDLSRMSPNKAISTGLALIPGDRQNSGGIGTLSILDNVVIQVIQNYFRKLRLNRKDMYNATHSLLTEFDVRPGNPRLDFQNLSGGNQQKALLAKWFQTNPKILLLDEPTQGVDVGARQQLFKIVREAAESGTSVICASSDYEQLATICNRVLIFAHGVVVRELIGIDITKERITEQCYNSLDNVVSL